jgi:CheY-like chemotaxis protein
VLLADDHPATAEQLRELLQPHFDVVALVGDGRALVSAAARLSPDVIVADISMPSLDGIDAAAEIRRCNPAARIGLVTVHAEAILLERGL